MADASNLIASKRRMVIQFFQLPSGRQVEFKAFLNDYADRFESEWSSETVYGRMDPMETFQGTRRTISLSWTVPSYDIKEAKLNLQKASLLMSMLYPAYDHGPGAGNISAAPLFRMKFTNLAAQPGMIGASDDVRSAGLVGRVSGFTYQPDQESGFFLPDGKDGTLYPQTINLECEFTVFHTHPLGWGPDGNPRGNPAVSGYPYGVEHSEQKENKRTEDVSPKTDAAKEAAADEILGGGVGGFRPAEPSTF